MSDKSTNRKINIWINGRQVENTYKSITSAMRKARNELANMTVGSKEYIAQTKKIKSLQSAMNEHLKMQGRIKTGWNKIKSSFSLTTLGFLGGFASIVSVVKNAIKIFTSFDKSVSKLKGILGATDEEMEILTNQAKDLGASTAYTASQVIDLQTELAKLGFPTAEIKLMTESTLNAAAAMGSELGAQAALTGSVLRSFNKDASEAVHVNDVLAKSTTKTALDFSKLQTALPIVSATAKSAGVDLERLTALLGTMADRGIDASSSATALRNIFLRLAKSGKTWDEAMNEINNSTNKNATAMELFGVNSSTAATVLSITANKAAEGKIKFDELEKSLRNADGAAAKLADTMLDNLSGDLTKAQSAWEGFILSLEDGSGVFSKIARKVTQFVSGVLENLKKFNEGDSVLLLWMKSTYDFDNKLKDLNKNFDRYIDIRSKKMEEIALSIGKINQQIRATRNDEKKQEELYKQREILQQQLDIIKEKKFNEEKSEKISKRLNTLKYRLAEILKDIQEEEAKGVWKMDGRRVAQLQYQRDLLEGQINHIKKISNLTDDVNKKNEETIKTEEKIKKTTSSKVDNVSILNKKYDDLNKLITQIRQQLNLGSLSEQEKEIEQIKQKYADYFSVLNEAIAELENIKNKKGALNDEELQTLNKFYNQRNQLVELQNEEFLNVEKKYEQKRISEKQKLQQKIDEVLMDDKQKEIHAVTKKYQELIQKAEEYGIDTVELYKKLDEEIKKIEDAHKKNIFGMDSEEWDKFISKINDAIQVVGELGDIIGLNNQRIANEEAAKLKDYEKNNTKKKEILKERLDKGLISERFYNQQIKSLDADLEREKAKSAARIAERDKKLRKYQATLDMFAGITSIWARYAARPLYAGILSAFALAKFKGTIKAINSEEIPAFAGGARVNKPTTALIGEAGPEIVLSSKIVQSKTLGPIADDLARIQEGKRPRFLSEPQIPNFAGMQKSIDAKNIPVVNNTVINQTDNAEIKEMNNTIAAMRNDISEMTQTISNLKYLRAIITNDDINEHQEDEKLRLKYSSF